MPVTTANDKELLFKNVAAGEIQGSPELEWDYATQKLTVGSGTSENINLNAPNGSIKAKGKLRFRQVLWHTKNIIEFDL